MFAHSVGGPITFSSSVDLGNAADHLNWLAKGSTNKEASTLHSQTNNPYPILKHLQYTVDKTA